MNIFRAVLIATSVFAPMLATADTLSTETGPVTVKAVITGLNEPWAIGFLPDGGMLVTERGGRLLHFTPLGDVQTVGGLPRIDVNGQGGLLDVLVPRDFAESRDIFLSYAKRQGRGSGTAVAKATLSPDGNRLQDVRDIFEMSRGTSGGRHFGSRIVEGDDGYLYITIGDRGDRHSAQDMSIEAGSVVRIARDGRIPADNPFRSVEAARPGLYSIGHRNPQGAALDAQGNFWVVEHGARGGDEINFVEPGLNYGWPVISYGTHYSGFSIGEGTEKEGLEQPAHYWDPSIAPSGMMIYQGDMFPEWRGDIFVGSLKFDMISRLDVNGKSAQEVERISGPETERVRDIRQAPDGSIWFLSVGNGAAYRISR